MAAIFPEFKKKLAFGCMRLPNTDGEIDIPQVNRMVDAFLEAGFNYFDTARPYHGGLSEKTVKTCLADRYPREAFVLTDKLSPGQFSTEAEIRPLLDDQLKTCGVEYFDIYLLHANSAERHKFFTETNAYNVVQELKAEGKIRHVGMSFHDSAEVLDRILTEHPELEVVQLQFNYVDYEDDDVQSKACYDVCVKHGKPVLVMEPVKGGNLVNLPEEAMALLPEKTPAAYALRFAASFPNIVMVLSGMSNLEQMNSNIAAMKDFRPLTEEEMAMISRIRTIYQAKHRIPCTGCRYCTDGCPAGIQIPDIFTCVNDMRENKPGAAEKYAAMENKADACLQCGQCETQCPQHLQIRALLSRIAEEF